MTLTGDDYRYRFEIDPKQRFIGVLRDRFNVGVSYKGRLLKWDTIIKEKTHELARYIVGKRMKFEFTEPVPTLERNDNRVVREAILRLTQREARELGIGKSTLHYLRMNAKTKESFRMYGKVRAKLASG